MKLFINGDVLRSNAVEIVKESNGYTNLIIRYLDENHKRGKYTYKIPYDIRYKKQLIMGLEMVDGENECEFYYTDNNETENYVYAILHSEQTFPSDVFILNQSVEQVKVIRKFIYPDYNIKYGAFTSKIYFVKLNIDNYPISIYLGSKMANTKNNHFNIYKEGDLIKIRQFQHNNKINECISLDVVS